MKQTLIEFQKLITTLQVDEGLSEHGVLLLEGFAIKLENELGQSLPIDSVSGSFVITESAKEKLDFILGHSTTRDFPKTQPTKEWAGAVLDFLEITKLLK